MTRISIYDEEFSRHEIFLNGERLVYCIEADSERGTATSF